MPDTRPPALAEILHDLRVLHRETTPGTWGKGRTTHETVAKRPGQKPYGIAEFTHASDAAFMDACHAHVPTLLDEMDRLRSASCPDCHKPTGGPDGVHTCSPQVDASAGRVDADDAARWRALVEPTEETILQAMEFSCVHRPSVDDDRYVLGILRIFNDAASRASQACSASYTNDSGAVAAIDRARKD